ncbi:calcium-binding protein [Burkholderia ubonensis]|uniref:Calcium-binding protein n=2 Tax=Burkholderia ubonensis TaxID=101571 RepID=A0A103QVV3_9BURK|nr:calcium-binding protein [Burkholderia ubonensis]KVG56528.1 calcium-binding protein [Burkholderia ubonensis]
MHLRSSVVAAVLAASAMSAVHAQTVSAGGYSLTVLGELGGPRGSQNYGSAVSADGKTIVGFNSTWTIPGHSFAFSWSPAAGWQRLAAPANAEASYAQTVSADGRIVGGSIGATQADNNFDRWAVRWSGDGRAQTIVPQAAGRASRVEVGNRDGSRMAGHYFSADGRNAMFLWDVRSGFASLTPTGDSAGQFLAMNQAGNAAAGFAGNVDGVYGTRAFLWTENAGVRLLPTLGTKETVLDIAYGVSDDGRTIVGTSDTGRMLTAPYGPIPESRAVRWTDGGDAVQSLGVLDGDDYSSATSISADGRVVIGESGNSQRGGPSRIYIWTQQSGMRSLDALLAAAGISVGTLNLTGLIGASPDGQTITGQGYREDDPDGKTQFWQVHIDAATLRSLPPASPGADVLRVRTSQLKAASLKLSSKQRAPLRGNACGTGAGRAWLVQCRKPMQAAH